MGFTLGRHSRFAAATVLLCLSVGAPLAPASKKAIPTDANERRRAIHALNRLTFGARPGDVEQVLAVGVDNWIDLQLHPEKIKDSQIESRLESLRTLRMSTKELAEDFPDAQMIRQVMAGKRSMPSDPGRRAIYQVQIARLREKRERKAADADEGKRAEPAAGPAQPASAAEGDTSAAMDSERKSSREEMSPPDASADTDSAANPLPNVDVASLPEMSPRAPDKPLDDPEAQQREDKLYADLNAQQLLGLSPSQRYKKVVSMSAEEQVALARTLRGGKALEFVEGMDPREKETMLAMNYPAGVVVEEISQAKLLRAIYSERQLEEVMTDFWFNHFNVYIGKGIDRLLVTGYERDAIRPHALGKFEDLLVATAKSPAMLFYLDNWLSVGPNSLQASGVPTRPMRPYRRRYPRGFPPPPAKPRRKQGSGLNENYGRELLELHTLSVNGGYSQRDVTEVAKVFTGWTIDKPFEGGGFRYEPLMHEPGPKFVLGHRIKPGGESEGREVLHRLAASPQTAQFISLKLAQRFVSDDPPPALVDRMAKVFLKKKGDIREVLRALFQSPEFWADNAYRAKVKTPFEFVVSSLRATGAAVDNAMPLLRQLNEMGMPLYGAQPPTGYSMKAETWVNSSGLLARMNFATSLATGKIRGVSLDPAQLLGTPPPAAADQALSVMENNLLAGAVSAQTHSSILAQLSSAGPRTLNKKPGPPEAAVPAPVLESMAGLLLGSPEFQRR